MPAHGFSLSKTSKALDSSSNVENADGRVRAEMLIPLTTNLNAPDKRMTTHLTINVFISSGFSLQLVQKMDFCFWLKLHAQELEGSLTSKVQNLTDFSSHRATGINGEAASSAGDAGGRFPSCSLAPDADPGSTENSVSHINKGSGVFGPFGSRVFEDELSPNSTSDQVDRETITI